MRRACFLILGLLFIAPASFSQTSSADSQAVQALVAEIRQLRQDLRMTTVAAQRAQILLYRLQSQEAAVARMERRVEEARSGLTETQSAAKQTAYEIKRMEERANDSQNPAERKRLEDMIAEFKSGLEAKRSIEGELQMRVAEAEQDLKAAQAKLGALQDRLDLIDKALENPNR